MNKPRKVRLQHATTPVAPPTPAQPRESASQSLLRIVAPLFVPTLHTPMAPPPWLNEMDALLQEKLARAEREKQYHAELAECETVRLAQSPYFVRVATTEPIDPHKDTRDTEPYERVKVMERTWRKVTGL